MKGLTLLFTLYVFAFTLSAQSFYYKSNLIYGVSINDAVELNGKFFMVGSIDSSGTEKPYFCILDNKGTLVFDTILYGTGRLVNIHEVNNILHISQYFNPFPTYHTFIDLQFDTNFVLLDGAQIADGILQKSKLIDDSTILYIGYVPPPFANASYTTVVAKQQIAADSVFVNFASFSKNPVEVYDIVSPSKGKYHLYTNSPDSVLTEQVSVFYLNDSLQAYRNKQLHSTYNLFGSDSSIRGTVAAEYKSSKIYMNATANHPTYLNQSKDIDLALIQFDTNYNELSITFSGKNDTDYTTSINLLSILDSSIYTAGTATDEILLNHYDSIGNTLISVSYRDASVLELKKILAFDDSLLIVGNSDDQFFAIKVGSINNQLITSLKEESKHYSSQIIIYPNPATNYIMLDQNDLKFKNARIYGQNGSLVKEYDNPSTSINVRDLKPGSYILQLISTRNVIQSLIFVKN